jgi:hypothetical protein
MTADSRGAAAGPGSGGQGLTATIAADGNAFVGPRPFPPDRRLYGRGRELLSLTNRLLSERLLLLYSPSGAGKTSLIQARGGLLERMAAEGFRTLPIVRVSHAADLAAAIGANRYLLSTLDALEPVRPESERRSLEALAGLLRNSGAELDPDFLHRYLAGLLPADADTAESEPANQTLLVFDQFEELLTLDPTDEPVKGEFMRQIGTALRDADRWALFVMREDHVAALDPYLPLVPSRLAATFRLDLLTRDAAREAVTGPTQEFGVTFEPAAVTSLIGDLSRIRVMNLIDGRAEPRDGPYVEPLHLQLVCESLWRQRSDPSRITSGDLDRLAHDRGDDLHGVTAALANYYDRSVEDTAKLPTARGVTERAIRNWFDRALISPSGLRLPVHLGGEASFGLTPAVVRELADRYLIRPDQRHGGSYYELAHDRLVEPIRRSNASWSSHNLTPFQLQATLWDARGRPESFLLKEPDLAEAERWAREHPEGTSELDRGYLKESRDKVNRIDVAEYKRVKVLAIAASITAAVAVVATGLALFYYQDARAQAKTASQARKEAENATHKALAAKEKEEKAKEKANAAKLELEKKLQDLVRAEKYAQDLSLEKQSHTKTVVVKSIRGSHSKIEAAEVFAEKGPEWENGTTLNILFINSLGDSSLGPVRDWLVKVRHKIREFAPIWEQYANLKLDFKGIEESTEARAHVTINLLPDEDHPYGTYFSEIGRRNLTALQTGSMSLVFEPNNPNNTDDEFRSVILHEFGHILGFIHEHSRPDRPLVWNENAVLNYYALKTHGNWGRKEVEYSVMAPYQAPEGWIILNMYRAFDVNSIMMFPFPPGLATYRDGAGFASGWNRELTPSDKVVANIIYPAKVPALPEESLTPGDPPKPGSIKIAGQVARYRFRSKGDSSHKVQTKSTSPLLLAVSASHDKPDGSLIAAEGSNATVEYQPKQPDQELFIEIRHARPMEGTGDFEVRVQALPPKKS